MGVKFFGRKSKLFFEIGASNDTSDYRRVDVWAAGLYLTRKDNSVHVGQFYASLRGDLLRLLSNPAEEYTSRPYRDDSIVGNHLRLKKEATTDNTMHLGFRFMDWGPTADHIWMHLFRESGTAILAFSFYDEVYHDPEDLGAVHVADLPEWELARVLNDVLFHLDYGD